LTAVTVAVANGQPTLFTAPGTPAGAAVKPARHVSAWTVMLCCGVTSLLFNLVHAIRHDGSTTDWVNIMIAVIYGVAPVTISVIDSHMATKKRAAWEVLVMLAVMVATMTMSVAATASLVRPVAGPVMCWVLPAVLDTATLIAFRMIVIPVVATGGRSWLTRPFGVPRPAGQPAGQSGGQAGRPRKAPATRTRPAGPSPAGGQPGSPGRQGTGPAPQPAPPDELTARRGPVETAMREAWVAALGKGRIPSGGDLNRAAGKETRYSLGKRYRARWLAELAETDPGLFAKLTAAPGDAADGDLEVAHDAGFPAHGHPALAGGAQ
jgi:hypothetical protein